MRRVFEKSRTVVPARAAAACCAALVLLGACATVPQRSPSEWMGALPPNATLYASLSVRGSAEFLKKMANDAGPGSQDISSLIGMTNRMVCSVTLSRGAPPQFSVVALGSYPSGIIGMRLAGNKDWKKRTGGSSVFWEWSKAGLQVSIPNNAILLAANGEMQMLLARWTAPRAAGMPPEVAGDMEKKDFVLYMPELPGGLAESAAMKGVHIPIQDVWMSAAHVQGGYALSGTANTTSEREAKLLTLVVRLGIVAWMRGQNVPNASERLSSITVTPSGSQVRLAGLHISEDELIPLFLSLVKSITPAAVPPVVEEPAQ
jgi:hypothetical protein